MLEDVFRAKYPSVRRANVVVDRMIGWPKGYGFVCFGYLNEQARAMTEMNEILLSTRQMRIGAAANKKNRDAQQTYATDGMYLSNIFIYVFNVLLLSPCWVGSGAARTVRGPHQRRPVQFRVQARQRGTVWLGPRH
jgi:RNA recognition motif-containing protein